MTDFDRHIIETDWTAITRAIDRAHRDDQPLDASAPPLAPERLARLVEQTMARIGDAEAGDANGAPTAGLSPAAPAQSATAAGAAPFSKQPAAERQEERPRRTRPTEWVESKDGSGASSGSGGRSESPAAERQEERPRRTRPTEWVESKDGSGQTDGSGAVGASNGSGADVESPTVWVESLRGDGVPSVRRDRETEIGSVSNGTRPSGSAAASFDGHDDDAARAGWSRARFDQLVILARLFRGWEVDEVADALARPVDAIVPPSNELTLDLLQRLARALEWTVADVVDALGADSGLCAHADDATPNAPAAIASDDFAALDVEMGKAFRRGDYHDMVQLGERAREIATTDEQRAMVCNRLSGAWDGLGYYERARREARRGLEEPQLPNDLRTMLASNLANAHYTLWEPFEAQAIATSIIDAASDALDGHAAPSLRDRRNLAWAQYVRGHSYRRLIALDPEQAPIYARQAARDLRASLNAWSTLADEFDDHEGYRGIAHTCLGGLIEVEVTLGERTADEALAALRKDIDDRASRDGDALAGAMLESCGWWCIFACNVVNRALPATDRCTALASFVESAWPIAARLTNWALRERVLTMEAALSEASPAAPRELTPERVRIVVGAMGRFRSFRATGWQMLQSRAG